MAKMSPAEDTEELSRVQGLLPEIEAGIGRTAYQQVGKQLQPLPVRRDKGYGYNILLFLF